MHARAPPLRLCDSVAMQRSRAGAGEGACAAATMELIYSRCNHCQEQAFQCSACLITDNATKKALRAAAAQAKIAIVMATIDAAFAAPHAPLAPQEPSNPAPAPAPPAAVVLLEKVQKKKRARAPKAKTAAVAAAVASADAAAASASELESDSDSDGLECDCDDGDDDGPPASKKSCPRKKSMPRILPAERVCVENWLQKTRKDGAMQNARWIRNGGAKHATMTATSAEVKTQGAYESLALYVNKSLKYATADPRFWEVDIAKRRWISLFKSFKEALLLDSKGNSMAGCTLLEIQTNSTSILKKQKLKCGSFDVMFHM